jgi:hypothetical protein
MLENWIFNFQGGGVAGSLKWRLTYGDLEMIEGYNTSYGCFLRRD